VISCIITDGSSSSHNQFATIFLFVFNRNMPLFVSDKYPQVYRLATGPKIQSRRHGATFVGLAPQTKF